MIGGFNYDNIFVRGNIAIDGNGWVYSESTTRVCSKEGFQFYLKSGDKVGLSSWGSKRLYVGILPDGGSYTYRGWLTEEFTCPYSGLYVFNIDNARDASEIASLFYIKELSQTIGNFAEGLNREIEELKKPVLDGFNLDYYGCSISPYITDMKQRCNRLNWMTILYGAGKDYYEANNSLAIADGKVFLFFDNTTNGIFCAIYDYDTKELIGEYNFSQERHHWNNAQFIDKYYDEDDNFPLLILSCGDYYSEGSVNTFFVVRVTNNYEFTLLKKVTCNIPQAQHNGSWVVDTLNNRLFCYTCTSGNWQVTENNHGVILSFELFDLEDYSDLLITSADIIDVYNYGYAVWQGGTCYNGKLYMPISSFGQLEGISGMSRYIIAVIDAMTGRILSVIPSVGYEDEGIAIYNGKIYESMKNGGGTAGQVCFRIAEYSFQPLT